jgi:plastocyanin
MKRFKLITIGLCCLAIIVGTAIVSLAQMYEKKNYTVAIQGPGAGSIPLANLTVKPGDSITFLNSMGLQNAFENEIKIVYKEGAKCQAGVHMSLGFAMDPQMCFASGWLKPMETATVVFGTPGVYNYEIQFHKSGGAPVTATITVVK